MSINNHVRVSNKKEWIINMCIYTEDKCEYHHAEWKELNTKKYVLGDYIYMKFQAIQTADEWLPG